MSILFLDRSIADLLISTLLPVPVENPLNPESVDKISIFEISDLAVLSNCVGKGSVKSDCEIVFKISVVFESNFSAFSFEV